MFEKLLQKKKNKQIEIIDEVLGKFVLNQKCSWFEGDVDWLGESCRVLLNLDEADLDTADKVMGILRELYKDLKSWDDRFRAFAADELTKLANDWLQDSVEEGEKPAPITKEEFMRRMKIDTLSVTPMGDLIVDYDDDDMFWGHTIEVTANIDGGISEADMVG